ncbi:hypothetical protein BGZ70_001738 [Mortierella alpina]|uniref:Uncharacterized protein n=1 Tax=Mortierella alpina TaxID=64518 RepID=A0A9P6M7C3_MORAP|nr:hypothetical protein BGZ70_001738 [Mortierella alpina]
MGMGPTRRKRRLLKALAEAGYMDEILDFDFDTAPAFWRLDPETRGNDEEELAKWTGIEELIDDGMDSAADDEALNELEQGLTPPRPPPPPPTTQPTTTTKHATSPPPRHQPNIVLWLDAGDRISLGFLRWLPSFLLHRGLWTPQSQDTLQTWTHPGLLQYYHDSLDRFAPDETNCNGAAIAFDLHNQTVQDGILKEWIDCAKIKECIAPMGSNRNNHRQDQAALTYLVKTMGFGQDLCHGFPEDFGIQVNQDRFCKQDIATNPNRVVLT